VPKRKRISTPGTAAVMLRMQEAVSTWSATMTLRLALGT